MYTSVWFVRLSKAHHTKLSLSEDGRKSRLPFITVQFAFVSASPVKWPVLHRLSGDNKQSQLREITSSTLKVGDLTLKEWVQVVYPRSNQKCNTTMLHFILHFSTTWPHATSFKADAFFALFFLSSCY